MADDHAPPSLYERDFYEWTQVQAEALRARGAGRNALDYDRLAEEVGDLGASEWNKVRSHLVRIIEHLHKLSASPATQPRNKWRAEIREHRLGASLTLTRSIRNGMERELNDLHRRGAVYAQAGMDDHEDGVRLDPDRRWTLAQLLGEEEDPLETLRP